MLEPGEYDAVVSDSDMPGEDGIGVVKSVRRRHPDLPFLLFTRDPIDEVVSEAVAAGVSGYQQKGTGGEQYTLLVQRLVAHVERRRAQRRRRQLREAIETARYVPAVLDSDGRIR